MTVLVFPFGGFLLVNSMANNGPMARCALLVLSLWGGGTPINNVHPEDMAVAERVETVAVWGVGVAMVAVFAVFVAFLCGAL